MNFVEISGENINEIEAIEILETECFGEGGVVIGVVQFSPVFNGTQVSFVTNTRSILTPFSMPVIVIFRVPALRVTVALLFKSPFL